MPSVATTGQKLKRLRLTNGLTQLELADKAGVAQSTIVYIERGERKTPHPRTLVKLSKALGVSPSDLLGD